jgi:hypothetical protein
MNALPPKLIKAGIFCCCFITCSFLISTKVFSQNTTIKGFADVLASYNKKASFGFDEQDLFITSQLNDRFSFLGESVFKYDKTAASDFTVSIERIIVKYNYYGNHNIEIGKVHTPINYWNDMYHHGRVFYPTIERPLLFDAEIIPLHTTGVNFQGHDLGNLKFGYDFMVGNGLGSSPVEDNDKYKSITAAVHIKPVDKMRIGASYYNDVVSKGATVEGKTINWKVNQQLITGSFAYFGKKFELLAESTMGLNHTDTTGTKQTLASYLYTGYKITQKIIPYIRVDDLHYQDGEILFTKNNTRAFVLGLRYQINYLAVVKLEYQHTKQELEDNDNKVTMQIAIGF